MNKRTPRTATGFTIVELLIVIVVIAILAAITIVAYNGIQNQAKVSARKSEMSQVMKQVQTDLIKTGSSAPSVKPPLAYTKGLASTLLSEPLVNAQSLTLYVVFDTETFVDSGSGNVAYLAPMSATSMIRFRTNPGDARMQVSYATSAQSVQTVVIPGVVRGTDQRYVGWIGIESSGGGMATLRSGVGPPDSANAIVTPHNGWNATALYTDMAGDVTGIAALVFSEYHDQDTRASIIQWLQQKHGS